MSSRSWQRRSLARCQVHTFRKFGSSIRFHRAAFRRHLRRRQWQQREDRVTQTWSTSDRVRRSPLRTPRRPSPPRGRRRRRRRRQIGTFLLPSFLLHSVGLSLSSVHLLQPSTLFPLHVFFQAAMFFRSPPTAFSTPLLSSSLLSSGVDKTSLYASGGGGSERVSSASRTASQAPTLPHSLSYRSRAILPFLLPLPLSLKVRLLLQSEAAGPLALPPSRAPAPQPRSSLHRSLLLPLLPRALLLVLVGKARLHFLPPFRLWPHPRPTD